MLVTFPAWRRLARMVVNCRASSAFLPRDYVSASRVCCSPVAPMPSADGPRYDGFALPRVPLHVRSAFAARWRCCVICSRRARYGSRNGFCAHWHALCFCLIRELLARAGSNVEPQGTTPTWHNNENAEYETANGHARGRRRRDDARLLSRYWLSTLCRCARHVPRALAAAFLVRDIVRVARRAARHASHDGSVECIAARVRRATSALVERSRASIGGYVGVSAGTSAGSRDGGTAHSELGRDAIACIDQSKEPDA